MSEASTGDRQTLYFLQYLRAAAALLVVLHHGLTAWQWRDPPLRGIETGALGVDLFFVLSGFIMFHVGRTETPSQFMLRRVIRIVPMYWLALIALYLTQPTLWALKADGVVYLLKSLLFIPFFNPMRDNEIWPILVPGWTLNYEMLFYVLFGIGLLTRRLWLTTAGALGALVVWGHFQPFTGQDPQWFALPQFYTQPVMLLFLAGMGLGWLYARCRDHRLFVALLAGLPLGLVWPFLPGIHGHAFIANVGSAMLIVAGLLAAERKVKVRPIGWLALLGNASFAIYLCQTLVRQAFAGLVAGQFGYGQGAFYIFLISFIALAIAIGVGVHLLIEKPLTRWLIRQSKAFMPQPVHPG